MRAQYRKGKIDAAAYEAFLEKETADVIRWQDEVGLDVLVHGEFERTDMVEYFGEQMRGFAFTENGMGAELRFALREAADSFRRRVAARADDGALVAVCAGADEKTR